MVADLAMAGRVCTSPGFAPFAAKMRAAALPDIAIATFAHYYAQLCAGAAGLVPGGDIDKVVGLPELEALAGHREAGRAALGRAVVIKLNGGLGTSMGMTQAK